MKKCKLFMILVAMTFTSFSQGIKPLLQKNNEDTFFCFDMQQAKILAQELESVWFKDSLNKLLLAENANLSFTVDKQKTIVSSLGFQVANLQQINRNHVVSILRLQHDKSKIIKKSKLHKFLLGTGLGIMSILAALH